MPASDEVTLVTCPEEGCGRENRSDSCYCDHCGSPLSRVWSCSLELEEGPFSFELPRAEPQAIVRIGRPGGAFAPEVDVLALKAPLGCSEADLGSVSRVHAALLGSEDGQWALRDLNSANGTLLNGRRVEVGQEPRLSSGDRIGLPLTGERRFHLVFCVRPRARPS